MKNKLVTFLMLLFSISLTGCSKEGPLGGRTVFFINDDGSYHCIEVGCTTGFSSLPSDPVSRIEEGASFIGWDPNPYYNKYESKYYATYSYSEYQLSDYATVRYHLYGDCENNNPTRVARNSSLYLVDPVRYNSSAWFLGWADSYGNRVYSLENISSETIDLYSVWEDNLCNVNIECNDFQFGYDRTLFTCYGMELELQASSSPNACFNGWYNSYNNLLSLSNSYTMTVNGNYTIREQYYYLCNNVKYEFNKDYYEYTVVGSLPDAREVFVMSDINGYKVTSIAPKAFYGNNYIVSFGGAGYLEEIGDGAFSYCYNLTTVDLSSCYYLRSIGSEAFYMCGLLSYCALPSNLSTINEYAFSCNYSLYSLYLPSNLTTLNGCVFYECDNLTLYLPTTVISTILDGHYSGISGYLFY